MVLSEYVNTILTVVITLLFSYIVFRIELESRLKDIENRLKILQPFENMVQQMGIKQVEKVFKEGKK